MGRACSIGSHFGWIRVQKGSKNGASNHTLKYSEDSDVFTYIKSNVELEDGRIDIMTLRAKYENDATRQQK